MDYKELANLIFPDAKDISYYEEKYPERNLPEGAIVTRFAPSPTGYVHIGGLYQSLVAKMSAKKTGGVFFLRIEDTDQKRKVENGVTDIVNSLKVFDMAPDEGMISETEWTGDYGPYIQSERKEIYQAYAKYMIEQGKAYPCFCTPEQEEERNKLQLDAKIRPGYYGVWAKCRNLTLDEMAEKIKAGVPYVIRFKSTGREDRKIQISDGIKGKITFPEYDIDIVIIKSDGLPTYHFAHMVDDHLMRTTHVIRGDEWLPSVPLHVQLFKEAGFKAPKYCHISPMMKNDNGNKRKLSKRKDPEAAVSYYDELGVPPDAVKEYLLNIANSTFENWRRQNKDANIEDFDFHLNKMSVSGALFDMVKLFDVAKIVISRYSAEKVYNDSYAWAKKYDEELVKLLENKDYALKVLGIERGNAKPRKDIAKWSDLKENISYMYNEEFDKITEFDFGKVTDKELANKISKLYSEKYFDINDDKQTWFDKMKDLAEEVGFAREVKEWKADPEKWPGHVGDISSVIRSKLTGRLNTPDLYEIIKVLGKDEVLRRLTK
ncbi:MAG TPA: glutamate--tRNA ligase [Clostridiaceae bacterium]|jgi:glutamate--tRNA ligase|nr:glutamate--tRNA ligase [Clostridiaceae bacterium]